MAINYSVTSNQALFASRTATFDTGQFPRAIAFNVQGSTAYLFTADFVPDYVGFYKFNPDTVSGTITTSSRNARFLAGTDPFSVCFHYNGSNSYLFASNDGSSNCYFWRFDPNTVSGDVASPTATFQTGSSPDFVAFYPNGVNSLVFVANYDNNNVYIWKVDPSTISGTVTSASRIATLNCGTNPRHITVNVQGNTAYVFTADSNGGSISFFKLDLTTLSGTYSPTATFSTGSRPYATGFYYNGSTSYLVDCEFGSNVMRLWRFNPNTVTGTVGSENASFATGLNPYSLVFYYNGVNSYAISSDNTGETMSAYKFDPATVSGSLSTPTCLFKTGFTPRGVAFWPNGANSYLLSNDDGGSTVSFYRGDLNQRTLTLALNSNVLLNPSAPIRKVSGGVLTLYSAIDYFTASLYLRAGASISASALTTAAFGWAFTTDSDTAGTLNEDFLYSGATASISGDYRLTMGAGRNLTLGTKGTYADSITIPSSGTLTIVADTTLGSDFILSAGTTIAKSGAGPYTLTLPYADPGLILGSGIILSTPQTTLTITGLAPGSEVRIFRISDDQELGGVESSGTSFAFSYNYSADTPVRIAILSTAYYNQEFTTTLTSQSNSIPISQRFDPNYLNP